MALSKILPHAETIKNAKKLSLFGENDSRRLSNFYELIFFESLVIFLEPSIKLITGIFDLHKKQ